MAKQLSILNVSGEILPYCKWTDSADYNSGLSLSLKEKGLDSRIMIPKYGYISERKNRIHDINRLREMPIQIGDIEDFATIKSSSFQNTRSKVQSYITTNDVYFNKLKGVIQDNKSAEEFPNNLERFAFFCRSVIDTCNLLSWFPDVIHINDWMSALVPVMARAIYPDEFKNTKFLFTIQDFYDQGEFDWKESKYLNLPDEYLKQIKNKNKVNLLKAGITFSDKLVVTDAKYLEHIANDTENSNGLSTIIKAKMKNISVIKPGIDHWLWNPVKDEYLVNKLVDDDWENFKYNNKVELVNKFGFEYHPKRAMFGIVSNFSKSRGFDYLLESIEELLKEDIQIVIMGDGDKEYRDRLTEISNNNPEKLQVSIGFDEYIAHTIMAGSDMYFSLAPLEALGMQFMHACKYGAVPITPINCALNEIAEDVDGEDGNCIAMKDASSKSLIESFKRALELYADSESFFGITKNCIYEEFGWDENTMEFEKAYRDLVK
jgi:starch synthase